MLCVFKEKSERKNPLWKLIGMCRRENWVWKRVNRRKNTCCVFLGEKTSGKTHFGSKSVCAGEKTGCGSELIDEKTHAVCF